MINVTCAVVPGMIERWRGAVVNLASWLGRRGHPAFSAYADEEGFITPQTMAYYVARARAGAGLITVEMASPERCGRHRWRELGIYDDRFLPGLRQLVAAIPAIVFQAEPSINNAKHVKLFAEHVKLRC